MGLQQKLQEKLMEENDASEVTHSSKTRKAKPPVVVTVKSMGASMTTLPAVEAVGRVTMTAAWLAVAAASRMPTARRVRFNFIVLVAC